MLADRRPEPGAAAGWAMPAARSGGSAWSCPIADKPLAWSWDTRKVTTSSIGAEPGKAAAPESSGTRLDPWLDAYADRAHGMRASEIRALFAVASRPEVVSLAGGMPFLEGLPMEILADVARRVITEHGAMALQYGSGQGDATLREQILDVMRLEGITAHPDDVVGMSGDPLEPHDVEDLLPQRRVALPRAVLQRHCAVLGDHTARYVREDLHRESLEERHPAGERDD